MEKRVWDYFFLNTVYSHWWASRGLSASVEPVVSIMCDADILYTSRDESKRGRRRGDIPPHQRSALHYPQWNFCWVGWTSSIKKQVLPKYCRKSASLSHDFATKSPLVAMGRPKFTPKLPLPFDDNHLHIHQSFDRPTHHPKRRPDPLSRFATVHFLDNQTDRQMVRLTDRLTDRWSKRQTCTKICLRSIGREQSTKN